MKITLHIGQSKTGTTAIQKFLSGNRNILKEHKILYPDYYLKSVPIQILNHNAFADSINGYSLHPHLSAETYWQQFMNQYKKDNYENIILSAESFYGGRPYLWETKDTQEYLDKLTHKILTIKSLIGEAQIRIIAYMRSQNEWLESAIPHIIRYEGTLGQRVYENDEQLAKLLHPFMDYDKNIGLWNNLLNPQKIILREYNRKNFPKENVIYDFLKQTNLDHINFNECSVEESVHDSWPRDFIEIKKLINKKHRHRIVEDATIDKLNLLSKSYPNKEKYLLSPDIHRRIFENFELGNNNISNKYNNGEYLFSKDHLDKILNRHYTKPEKSYIESVMKKYKKFSYSPKGIKIFLFSATKRMIRKSSPFLYSILAIQWKNRKIRNQ